MNIPQQFNLLRLIENVLFRSEAGLLARTLMDPKLLAYRTFQSTTVASELDAVSNVVGQLQTLLVSKQQEKETPQQVRSTTPNANKADDCECERVKKNISFKENPETDPVPVVEKNEIQEIVERVEEENDQEDIVRVLDEINEKWELFSEKTDKPETQPKAVGTDTVKEQDQEEAQEELPDMRSLFGGFLAGLIIQGDFSPSVWVSGLSSALGRFLRFARNTVTRAARASSSFLRALTRPVGSLLARFPNVMKFFSGLIRNPIIQRLPVLGHIVTIIMDAFDTNAELKELTKQRDLGLVTDAEYMRRSRTIVIENVFRTAGTILGSSLGAVAGTIFMGPFFGTLIGGVGGAAFGRMLGDRLGQLVSPWILSNFFADNSEEAAEVVARRLNGQEPERESADTETAQSVADGRAPVGDGGMTTEELREQLTLAGFQSFQPETPEPAEAPEPVPAMAQGESTPEPVPAMTQGESTPTPAPATGSPQSAAPISQPPRETAIETPEPAPAATDGVAQRISYNPEEATSNLIVINNTSAQNNRVIHIVRQRPNRQMMAA